MIGKLHQALQQRLQLAVQQAFSIGEFLSASIKAHGSTLPDEDHQPCRRRPRGSPLLETLDSIESLGASSSCLQDQVLIFQTISNFPLLSYVNEPMSHFVVNDVRLAIRHLAAALDHKCDVPGNIHDAHINMRPFRSLVTDEESPPLSGEMRFSTVTPCDGDGLVVGINFDHREPLENAEYARFFGIDAPELSSVHFIKTNDLQHVFCKQVGHISLCAVHLFLHMFLFRGSAKPCEELPREAAPQPRGIYNTAPKEHRFKFTTPPSQHLEKVFLQSLEELVPPTSESRKRLVSPFPASMATASNPFLCSLNALLVVSGFCHVFTRHCQDRFLLGLQATARENKLGPIWCGASWKFIIRCTFENNTDFFFEALHTRNNISLGKSWFSLQKLKCLSPMARKTNVETAGLTGDYKNHSQKSPGTASPRNRTPVWHVY